MELLNEDPTYRSFINQRDRELEVFHNKTQRIVSDLLRDAFTQALLLIQANHSELVNEASMFQAPALLGYLDRQIEQMFGRYLEDITEVTRDMRRNAYVMAHAGETEAIGRSLNEEKIADITPDVGQEQEEKEAQSGGNLILRVKMYLDRIRRQIMNAVQLGMTNCDERREFMTRVYKALPKQKIFKRPPKNLKTVKEARGPTSTIRFGLGQGRKTPVAGVSMTVGEIDQQTWDVMVEDYLDEYIPVNRGPEAVIDLDTIAVPSPLRSGKIPPVDQEKWYVWELERDINQEFIQSVRDGQIDAANKNGINEFVWISIVDNKTDTCCTWRDGLTTSEIERKLKSDKKGDKCKSITPPAHFNCRCTLAPATPTLPGKPATNLGDFDKWLQG